MDKNICPLSFLNGAIQKLRLAAIPLLVLIFISSACGRQTPLVNLTSPGTTPVESSAFSDTSSPLTQNRIAATSPAFAYWQTKFPGDQWAALAQGDLNNDGRADLVVLYGTPEGKYSFVVVLNLANGFQITDPIDAPPEDQVLRIFDMDDRPPNEFSVAGQKDNQVGMAIFHLENGVVTLLITEGYGACCS